MCSMLMVFLLPSSRCLRFLRHPVEQKISHNLAAFASHKNIAYRFMSPGRLARAIDISVTHDPCIWTRIFLMFRGLSDDDMGDFASAGEKEANMQNWREVVGYSEASKDHEQFRVLEVSILECT